MVSKIENFLFYDGFDQSSYELAQPKIYRADLFVTTLISLCATFLISFMYISTFFVSGVRANRIVYLVGALLSLTVTIFAFFYAKNHTWIIMPLVYVSCFIFYTYGILIGTVTDPDQKTVTFIVTLVLLPVLFIDRPIRLIINNGIYILAFVARCSEVKTGAVLQNDIIDAVIFGALGLVSGIIINRMKVYGYILEQRLKAVSRFDQLTQLNNRNAYELRLPSIPDKATVSLSCIYVDVNGLHELNNERGHAFGDEMLKYVAEQIRAYFGEDFSFRIGGDEFVIFVPDRDKYEVEQKLHEMVKNIEREGYHVATGSETMDARRLSLDNLIKSAESKMYKNKKQFYKDRANDRRHDL